LSRGTRRERVADGSGDVVEGRFGVREGVGVADEAVEVTVPAAVLDGDAGVAELRGVGFALVAQDVVFDGDDVGGWQSDE